MAGVHDLERLRSLLGGDDLRWLRQRLRGRFERGDLATGTVNHGSPSPEERAAVDLLFGRRPTSGSSLRIDIAALEQRLRDARLCDTLRDALEALDGPIRDRRAERENLERAWARVEGRLDEACVARPWLTPWWEQVRAEGLLRRLSGGDPAEAQRLADRLVALLHRLPAQGVALPELAAQVTGDAHALDRGAPLGTLAARAAAVLGGAGGLASADDWREAWAGAGVICDEVSAPVLTLNLGALEPRGTGLTDGVLALYRAQGELCALTLRQLVDHPPDLSHLAGRDVFVCENPTVAVAATRRLGAASAPLVCTAGQLRASTRFLLRRIADAGGRLRVRADFDATGLRIVKTVLEHPGAVPWRMGIADYLSCAGAAQASTALPTTPWDSELAEAMAARRTAVHEESLLEQLLSDLVVGRGTA